MNTNELIAKLAFQVLRSDDLEDKYAGFLNIIKTLTQEGSVLFPKNSPEIEHHLNQFSFVVFEGDVPDSYEIIKFSLDPNCFILSSEFKEHISNDPDLSIANLENEKHG